MIREHSGPTDFFDMVKTLPHWQSSLLAHLDSEQHPDRLKQLLESGDTLNFHLVSDGGTKGDLLQSTVRCSGPAWDQHAFCSLVP
jgi:hypothetical protein